MIVTQLCSTLCDPWPVAHQAPLSMGFSREEYWSGLPFPSPGDLPKPGIEPMSPALAGGFFTTKQLEKPLYQHIDEQIMSKYSCHRILLIVILIPVIFSCCASFHFFFFSKLRFHGGLLLCSLTVFYLT